jgi:serine/threonine protein phosphatase 1
VNERFVNLGQPHRLWVIPAIHGMVDRLEALHDHLLARIDPGDRLLYLGNYVGMDAEKSAATLDELLSFRSALLAKPGMMATDFAYLRGRMEETWQRLLRLQFASIPAQTLQWLIDHGVEGYLRLYGVPCEEAFSIARSGSLAITRWTSSLRIAQRKFAGHEEWFNTMRRAAYTDANYLSALRLLFVPTGYNPRRKLDDQGDEFWWPRTAYHEAADSKIYNRIIRGFDPDHQSPDLAASALTLDGGAGRGGPLHCGCLDSTGRLIELIAVGGTGVGLEKALPLRDVIPPEPMGTRAPSVRAPANRDYSSLFHSTGEESFFRRASAS